MRRLHSQARPALPELGPHRFRGGLRSFVPDGTGLVR
jgi:hypothetical protein